jgi:hypothetical protein
MSIITLPASEPDLAAQPYERTDVNISTELLELFEKSLAEGKARVTKAEAVDCLLQQLLYNI